MSRKPKTLIQLDSDSHASSFDAMVAIDAGVEQLLSYSSVEPLDVQSLVHGAIFTRSPSDLRHTAIFIGGQNVQLGEEILRSVIASFLGPLRVSVLVDPNGSNTTAAAAVLIAEQHIELRASRLAVLAATGPVGRRVARLAAGLGASVAVASRQVVRAEEICRQVTASVPNADVSAITLIDHDSVRQCLDQCDGLVCCGAAGAELLTADQWQPVGRLKLVIDLNAVPPAGAEGVQPADRAVQRAGKIVYGAIGVGTLKMKIHRRAIAALFEANDHVFDLDQIVALGRELISTESSPPRKG